MKQKIFFLFLGVVFFLGFISAAPGIPHQFYGEVVVNGEKVVENNVVVAAVGGDYYAAITSDGEYGNSPGIFYVENPEGDRSGDVISFYLGGRVIDGVYDFRGKPVGSDFFETNGLTRLDIDSTTVCGDGFCIGEETCSSCDTDCGICTEPPVITISSPVNKVYDTDKIDLVVSSDQAIFQWMYSLNGAGFVTFSPDIVITGFVNETTGVGENKISVIGFNNQFQSGMNSVDFRIEIVSGFCGDGVCGTTEGESCGTCPGDCGACSGGGGSGSGGGSGGGGGGSGGFSGSAEEVIVDFSYEDSGDLEETGEEKGETSYENEKGGVAEEGFFSAMTGAVVGVAGSRTGIGIGIFFLLAILVFVFVWIRRKLSLANFKESF